jgi:AraC family transcriptional regulator of adaptative response/methylated-DNA-[protein]-cysteine methyltransferase
MKNSRHFETISRCLYWLVENQHAQPTLKQMSVQFGISEFHLQKTFQELVGVSPKQFLKHISKEEAISRLKLGQTVLDTALDLGLSGPGRLHDLLVTTEAITPGQARQSGKGVNMNYGFGATPFGDALIAWTPRGISFLGFCRRHGREKSLSGISKQWPGLNLNEKSEKAIEYLSRVFNHCNDSQLKVWLRGSPFQLKVWEALLNIPSSSHCTYGQIAQYLGNPRASRAIGTAIGRNPVSWLIPCHRVITSMGALGGYRWGIETKQAMIGLEASRIREVA